MEKGEEVREVFHEEERVQNLGKKKKLKRRERIGRRGRTNKTLSKLFLLFFSLSLFPSLLLSLPSPSHHPSLSLYLLLFLSLSLHRFSDSYLPSVNYDIKSPVTAPDSLLFASFHEDHGLTL